MPSKHSPSRRKCNLSRLVPSSSSSPARLLPVIPVFAVGLREGRSSDLTMKWAEAQASQKQRWLHGRKPQSGAELPPQRWNTARLCQHPLRARSQPELTAAMTLNVSLALVFSLEKFPGRLSCVKAQSQTSAFYRALGVFCTLVTEGHWSRRGCCPDTTAAEFVLPVPGQAGQGFGLGSAEGQQWGYGGGYALSLCSYSAAGGSPQTSCRGVQGDSGSGRGEQPAAFLHKQTPFTPMTNALLVPEPRDSAIPCPLHVAAHIT